uniref:cucumisin-like n=1 Tax=Fragaria vesca subsp. vesca TaxID=101020 RepID=UPI0005C9D9A9|nr:PREDICTED: cucumisin-like [Fragaria vesca subsp. vesca]
MPLRSLILLSLIGSILLLVDVTHSATQDPRKAYVVYMGDKPKNGVPITPDHHVNILRDVVDNNINNDISHEALLVHSYRRSFHGFAAMLTEKEAEKLAEYDGVVSIFPSKKKSYKTTRSWDFVGFPQTIERMPLEREIIIGVMDTGIWPEAESFSDVGFGPPPKKWKGICQGNNNFTCNNNIIGARYYLPSGSSNSEDLTDEFESPRDANGHGTHTASTAAGNLVRNASQSGLGFGTASGGVPSAHIAVYKVCWGEQHCDDADILRAFDDAIDDGVDVISASLGGSVSEDYLTDSVAIGSFHAMRTGIFVSNAAGNDGPKRKTVEALAPWLLSVAASTINRKFITKVQLGNGKIYEGLLPNSKDLEGKFYNLVYGGNVPNETDGGKSSYCLPNSLDKEKIKGKIVLCDYGPAPDTSDNGDGAIEGGAVGVILTSDQLSEQLSQSDYHFPVATVGLEENSNIYNYINQTSNPTATLWKSEEIDDVLAPYITMFSSRGPNPLNPNILKPDLAAPGSNILAAIPPNDRDNSNTRFELMSGTSMACPHASGVAAYVKSIHPEWSPAAILSALITTAKPMSVHTTPHAEFAYGAGLINPSRAPFPGLVYDLELQDYIDFLCSKGYRGKELEDITKDKTISCSSKSTSETTYNLNYASIALCIKDPESFSGIFHRTVTNVGSPNSRYKAEVMAPLGLKISVEPNELSFTSLQEKKSFVVKIEGPIEKSNIVSASMVWDDGNFQVRSPVVVYMDF